MMLDTKVLAERIREEGVREPVLAGGSLVGTIYTHRELQLVDTPGGAFSSLIFEVADSTFTVDAKGRVKQKEVGTSSVVDDITLLEILQGFLVVREALLTEFAL
jgi:hypothetical protein